MARYFGITDGDGEFAVTTGTSTTSKDIEVVINTNANVGSIQELLNGLSNIENFIIRTGKNW
jgi:hypothetical protein